VKFTKERKAFGKTVFEFQNTKFTLADMAAKLQVGWAHLDWAIRRHIAGSSRQRRLGRQALAHRAAMGSVRRLAPAHGGAGYMNEYLIARLWRDARVTRIFGGTNEIMKEVVSRSL
jgi:long-chain-acyl-CoA dehydrogenase